MTKAKAESILKKSGYKTEKSEHKFKKGGHVKGEKSKERLDKKARGGKNKPHNVNVIVANKQPQPMPQGMPQPMPAPPQAGLGPMPPQGNPPMKKGGKVGHFQNKTGGGGGLARLAREKNEKKKGF